MSKIVRCPHCLESVYATAKVCPHCEESLRRSGGRIFTRGAVIFVVVALVGWTITDAVILIQEKQKLERRLAETSKVAALIGQAFEAPGSIRSDDLADQLKALRNDHADAFPQEVIDGIHVTIAGRSALRRAHGFHLGLTRARRYRFSMLLSRGGKWFGLEGMAYVNGGELVDLDAHEVTTFGVTRPAWRGDRHLQNSL